MLGNAWLVWSEPASMNIFQKASMNEKKNTQLAKWVEKNK